MADESLYDRFTAKLRQYTDIGAARDWLEANQARVMALFENLSLRDFVFEPIKGVFVVQGGDAERAIRQTITTVAVANMVMAGLPGKLGVGVFVSMALEGWMAWVIASRVGISLRRVSDIWTYFGLLAGVVLTIVWLFKALLGLAFALFSVIPGINPLIFAELLVTNLVGVLFWVGFKEAAATGSFSVPMRAVGGIWEETQALFSYQWDIIRHHLSWSNLSLMGQRLWAWLSGDIPDQPPRLRGELLTTAAMAWLLARDFARFDGPLGTEFIAAIRDRYPDLAEASLTQIADHMAVYDPDQLAGVISLIKGKLFERLVALHENADGDGWQAVLHEDESFPGSDIELVNEATGEVVAISLKATGRPDYIEEALLRYPDIPLLTTDEVAARFAGDPRVTGSGFSNEELTEVTEENFAQLLDQAAPLTTAEVAGAGVALGALATLWPFTLAYLRGRISDEQLGAVFTKVLGDAGVALAARVSYAVVLGPVFAWYLLARGVMGLTQAAAEGAQGAITAEAGAGEAGSGPAPPWRRLVWWGRSRASG